MEDLTFQNTNKDQVKFKVKNFDCGYEVCFSNNFEFNSYYPVPNIPETHRVFQCFVCSNAFVSEIEKVFKE